MQETYSPPAHIQSVHWHPEGDLKTHQPHSEDSEIQKQRSDLLPHN